MKTDWGEHIVSFRISALDQITHDIFATCNFFFSFIQWSYSGEHIKKKKIWNKKPKPFNIYCRWSRFFPQLWSDFLLWTSSYIGHWMRSTWTIEAQMREQGKRNSMNWDKLALSFCLLLSWLCLLLFSYSLCSSIAVVKDHLKNLENNHTVGTIKYQHLNQQPLNIW